MENVPDNKPQHFALANAPTELSNGIVDSPAIAAITQASRHLAAWQLPEIAGMTRFAQLAAAAFPTSDFTRLSQAMEAWKKIPAIAEMNDLSRIAAAFHTTDTITRFSQTLAALQQSPAIAEMTRFSKLAALHATDAISRFSQTVAAWQKSPAFADMTSFSSKLVGIHTNDEFARLSQTMAAWQKSPVADDITKAMRDLPAWLKPRSFPDALMPSWQVAARLGAAGAAPASLVHDLLGVLHEVRADTIAFEATVRMAEGIDGDERDLAEVALSLLRQYTTMLVDLLLSATDFVKREGIIATVGLLIAIVGLYEAHLSRLYSAEQTELSRERTEIARTAAASDPAAPIHREIAEHLQILERQVAQLDRASDPHMRVVAQTAPLRLEPHAKAPIIRKLYPDDRVRVLEVKGGWALVEVYEYKSEVTTTGWISRRALRLPY